MVQVNGNLELPAWDNDNRPAGGWAVYNLYREALYGPQVDPASAWSDRLYAQRQGVMEEHLDNLIDDFIGEAPITLADLGLADYRDILIEAIMNDARKEKRS